MKYKTCDLEGARLDAAVALAEGYSDLRLIESRGVQFSYWAIDSKTRVARYGTDWQHGGKIIERERISIVYSEDTGWSAEVGPYSPRSATAGTPLIAAMRAYVLGKSGEEIELP